MFIPAPHQDSGPHCSPRFPLGLRMEHSSQDNRRGCALGVPAQGLFASSGNIPSSPTFFSEGYPVYFSGASMAQLPQHHNNPISSSGMMGGAVRHPAPNPTSQHQRGMIADAASIGTTQPPRACAAVTSAPLPWVSTMLNTAFFGPCDVHKSSKKNESTYFCVTCATGPSGHPAALCNHCMSQHQGHQVIQIRRYVYCDVIRSVDINQYMDTAGVQCYIINQARVVFLNPRPQSKMGRPMSPDTCRTCSRHLREGAAYCCLACKVTALAVGDNWIPPANLEEQQPLPRAMQQQQHPAAAPVPRVTQQQQHPAAAPMPRVTQQQLQQHLAAAPMRSLDMSAQHWLSSPTGEELPFRPTARRPDNMMMMSSAMMGQEEPLYNNNGSGSSSSSSELCLEPALMTTPRTTLKGASRAVSMSPAMASGMSPSTLALLQVVSHSASDEDEEDHLAADNISGARSNKRLRGGSWTSAGNITTTGAGSGRRAAMERAAGQPSSGSDNSEGGCVASPGGTAASHPAKTSFSSLICSSRRKQVSPRKSAV